MVNFIEEAALSNSKILFGEEIDPLLAKAHHLLVKPKKIPYGQLLELCRNASHYRTVAKIIAAAIVTDAHLFPVFLGFSSIEIFCQPFSRDDGEWRDSLPDWTSYGFLCAVPLGIFQAGVFIDNYPEFLNNFEIVDCLVDLITWNGKIPNLYVPSWSPSKEYEAELSEAVKAYFRPSSSAFGRTGKRLAAAQAIMEGVVEYQKSLGKERELKLSVLGEMILRQICFAVAGPMNPAAFADAISSYLRQELLSAPSPKEGEEIAKSE